MKTTEEGIKTYLEEIGTHRVLTREQEVELFTRLESGDESAREEIVGCNLKLVVSIAAQFMGRGLPLEDLIQEGNIGLIEVIPKFDHRRGFRFSTYAAFWIRQAMQQALRRQVSFIRLPVRKSRMLGTLTEVINNRQNDLCRQPTVEELAQAMDVDQDQMEHLMQVRECVLSLDEPCNEGGQTLGDTLQSGGCTVIDILEEEQCQERIDQALSHLNERERRVMELRFGFESGRSLSLRHTSRVVGLSQEGVRRIEQKALTKLRRPAVSACIAGLL